MTQEKNPTGLKTGKIALQPYFGNGGSPVLSKGT